MQVIKIVLLFVGLFISVKSYCQDYTSWEEHDIIRFYKIIQLEDGTIDEEGEEIESVFIPTKPKSGAYTVEVNKLSSKIYHIKGSDVYIYFQYPPYLYNGDEGVVVIDGYGGGKFYEEP
jgi:hypothetical protein